MQCKKCGYTETRPKKIFGHHLCKICRYHAPKDPETFESYINERIDWKILDIFRKFGSDRGEIQKQGMIKRAEQGIITSRPPFGYDIREDQLIPNQDAIKVRSLFKTFLARNYSLNSLAKNFGFSTNGIKKILTNRTYLGEIKFDHKIYKSTHKPIISPEIFYATQRKLRSYLKPKK